MKKPVPNDIPVLSASSGQPEEEPGEPSLEDATDKLEKPYAERGNETPELVNQPSKRRYPDRIRKPTINWTCKSSIWVCMSTFIFCPFFYLLFWMKQVGVYCIYVFARVRGTHNIVEHSGINGCLNHMFMFSSVEYTTPYAISFWKHSTSTTSSGWFWCSRLVSFGIPFIAYIPLFSYNFY